MAIARPDRLILGEAVVAALASMRRPLGPAAALLAPQAQAMTDVTGFGLAGHLLEMLEASGCAAELWLDRVPLLPGAAALSAAGHGSSLAPANRAAVLWRMTGDTAAPAALLYDPQTAGGLLAAVPVDKAEALIAALQSLGEEVAVIGRLVPGAPLIRVIRAPSP